MRLYKVPNSPFWYYTDTTDGRRVRKSTKRTNKTEAKEVAVAAVRERLNASQLGAQPEMTLREGLERLLAESATNRDQRGLDMRKRKLMGEPPFETRYSLAPDMKLHEITSDVIARLRSKRIAEGNAPGTVNREMSLVQKLYNAARVWGVRTAPYVAFPKYPVEGKLRYLTYEEADRLLTELDPAREGRGLPANGKDPWLLRRKLQDQYDLAVFLLDTGARYSEVATITWDAIDTRDWKWINIYHWKVGKDGRAAMTARLKYLLQRRRQETNAVYVFPGYGDDGGPRGYATKGIRNAIERARLNAPHLVQRYGRCTVHTLRDTFASWLVMNGMSLYKVQKLLGHSTPQMTQKYAKLAPDDVADEAAEILNGVGVPKKDRNGQESAGFKSGRVRA